MDASGFALRAADALAGNLNLRRTLGRLVDLAAGRFGLWAAVTVADGGRCRQVASDGGRVLERLVRLAQTEPLEDLLSGRPRVITVPAPELLGALGIPPGASRTPGLRLALAPMSGHPVEAGVLAVLGTDAPDLDELVALARRGATAIAAARVYEERSTLASTLRAALLPAPLPSVVGVDLGASYRPAQQTTQIGGDFYDVIPRPTGDWTFSMGDVCGKGVDAAVLTGQVRQSLRTAALAGDDPAATLKLVNDTMMAGDGSNFVTVVHGLLRPGPDGAMIRLAVGGHPPPLLLRGAEVTTVPVRGTIVGMLADVDFTAVDVQLGPGDLLLAYTDGATEARADGAMLGIEPIEALLSDCAGLTAQAVTERMMQLVLQFLGEAHHDDIAFLAIRAQSEPAR